MTLTLATMDICSSNWFRDPQVAKEHIAEQAKLRAAKEAAEAMQAQIQRDMKEEMERLKTQLMFRQHEIETSMRKPAMMAPPRRAPPTPAQGLPPPQMRRWDSADIAAFQDAGPSIAVQKTPARPRFGTFFKDVPSVPRKVKHQPPPLASVKNAMLPGFVNAFTSVSPDRARADQPQGKGKERAQSFIRQQSQWELDAGGLAPRSPPSSPLRPNVLLGRADAVMEVDEEPTMLGDLSLDPDVSLDMDIDVFHLEEPQESAIIEDPIMYEPPDWVARVRRSRHDCIVCLC